MYSNLEKIRDSYYSAVLNLTDPELIKKALPTPTYTNFFKLSDMLLKKLEEDIEVSKQELLQAKDDVEKEFLQELIKISQFKIDIIKQNIVEAEAIRNEEIEALTTPDKILIFAKTSHDRIYFEQDLKDIPEEYFDKVLDCLEDIKNGRSEDNIETARMFTSINSKLAGLHEAKRFKIRVAFKVLSKDILYVMIVRQKKADNDSVDRKELESRIKVTEVEFKQLKEDLKDEKKKQEIIDENEQIRKEIFKKLGGEGFGGI